MQDSSGEGGLQIWLSMTIDFLDDVSLQALQLAGLERLKLDLAMEMHASLHKQHSHMHVASLAAHASPKPLSAHPTSKSTSPKDCPRFICAVTICFN